MFLLPLYLRYIISADSDYREEMKAGMVYRFSTIFDGMDYHEILEYFQNAAEEAGKYYNQKIVEEIKRQEQKVTTRFYYQGPLNCWLKM